MEEPVKAGIAIIIPGGIGTGRNSIGVPVLEQIIKLLSVEFDLTVFQLSRKHESFKVTGFDLIEIYSSSATWRALKFFVAFLRIRRVRKFKAIHGFWVTPCGFLAVLAGRWFGIKSVVSVLGGDAIFLPEIRYGQLNSPLYRLLTRWTLRHAEEANALTQYLIENLTKVGIVRADMKVIPWGVDTAMFDFREKPLEDAVQFLHIASLHPVKDQETLLRAFRIIRDSSLAHLTIIGEGISECGIRSMIEELNLQDSVTISGLVLYSELPRYYHSADILLHTSLSEGQSEVVTEAMSCGVLVCGTDVGLLYDLPDCCVSVPIRNYESLAQETLKLIGDPSKRDQLRNLAHQWTSKHNLDWTVGKIKKCYFGRSSR